ncbi:hypothetical protein STCU_10275 [Strigomonas culicis]|uniref:Uncharacterized protein n=1 Tax=Strigomonas culicis TaxID=28005 RepID=S9TNL7_9TRYP|nr:hypothetical protein STCU_10275 [Strigomonas culicis]|eukprot:EPY17983.1 hypothetical protein STCU_10275 [Strigomonas culicis]
MVDAALERLDGAEGRDQLAQLLNREVRRQPADVHVTARRGFWWCAGRHGILRAAADAVKAGEALARLLLAAQHRHGLSCGVTRPLHGGGGWLGVHRLSREVRGK